MSIFDEIVALRLQITAQHGEPPDFIVVPFDRMPELESQMTHSMMQRTDDGVPFAEKIVCGKVAVAQVTILSGKRWGAGVNVA